MKCIVRKNPLMTTYTQYGSNQGQKGQIDNYTAAAWNFIIENICLWCWFLWGSLGLRSYGFGLRQCCLWWVWRSAWPVVFAWGSVVMAQLDFGRWFVWGRSTAREKGVFMGGPHWRFALGRVVVLLQCKVLGIWHRCRIFYEFIFYWKKVIIEKV